MKITREHWNGEKGRVETSVSDAIEGSVSHTNSEGSIERLQEQVDTLAKIVGVVVEALTYNKSLTSDDLANMLSWNYRVEN